MRPTADDADNDCVLIDNVAEADNVMAFFIAYPFYSNDNGHQMEKKLITKTKIMYK